MTALDLLMLGALAAGLIVLDLWPAGRRSRRGRADSSLQADPAPVAPSGLLSPHRHPPEGAAAPPHLRRTATDADRRFRIPAPGGSASGSPGGPGTPLLHRYTGTDAEIAGAYLRDLGWSDQVAPPPRRSEA